MVRTTWTFATVYALFVVTLVHCDKHCPHVKCRCDDKEIECSNIPEMEDIEKIMGSVRDKSIKAKKFRLTDTHLPALPAKVFEGTGLKRLDFVNVTLPFIAPPFKNLSPFTGLENLEEIHFKGVSYMYNWNWTMFTNLKSLHTFVAEGSLFVYVSKSFSDMDCQLKHLNLINCQIHWIQDGAFSGFSAMSKFVLTDNNIVSFPRSLLPIPATHLRSIDLRNNKLETLPSDFFSEMPELSAVWVNNNNLKTLPESVKNGVLKSFTFYVEDNPFVCDCDLHWICSPPSDHGPRVDYGKTTCSEPNDLEMERMCKTGKRGCKNL